MIDIPFHPLSNLFPMMAGPEFDAFVEDVRRHGIQTPVTLYQGHILDGKVRYRAAELAGVRLPTTIYTGSNPAAFVISQNFHRRHLNESQRAMIAARVATMGRGRPSDNPHHCGISAGQAAVSLYVGTRSIENAREVLKNGVPEIIARIDAGTLPVSIAAGVSRLPPDIQTRMSQEREAVLKGAAKAHSRATREEDLADRIETETARLGVQRYGVIYIDPPWEFEVRNEATGSDRAASNHYPTMPDDEIMELEIPSAENCMMFCWVTIPKLPSGILFLGHHEFVYKSAYCWHKPGHGMGKWYMADAIELLLIGMKGSVPAPAPGDQPPQLRTIPRGLHSAKPEVFAQAIETMFPNVPKLEMFHRGNGRAGWDTWGAEAETPVSNR
jgi:N6-adenosine-specific RNA methylase IME4